MVKCRRLHIANNSGVSSHKYIWELESLSTFNLKLFNVSPLYKTLHKTANMTVVIKREFFPWGECQKSHFPTKPTESYKVKELNPSSSNTTNPPNLSKNPSSSIKTVNTCAIFTNCSFSNTKTLTPAATILLRRQFVAFLESTQTSLASILPLT